MGINYLALNDLFQMSNKWKGIITYDIYDQMVEIYNEQVRDILAEDSSKTKYPFSMDVLSSTFDNQLIPLPYISSYVFLVFSKFALLGT